MKIYHLILLMLLNSCASYINKIHSQIKNGERRQQMSSNAGVAPGRDIPYNPFSRKQFDKRPINNPVTFNSAAQSAERPPSVRRQYHAGKRRYQADDLVDQGTSGSLWTGQDKENYLFSDNRQKTLGDMIIIDVLEDLRNDIANELKRAFPVAVARKKTDKKGEAKAEDPAAPAGSPAKPEDPNDTKIYDKISGQVIEIISKDYILVRGRKEVLFRKQKRLIDVQALVSKNDLTNDDTIVSDKILEQKITVLR